MEISASQSVINEVHDALANLYLSIKVRSTEDLNFYGEGSFKEEKDKLENVSSITLIEYIKDSIEVLIALKNDESKNSSMISDKSSSVVQKGYNEMLQNLENEIRMHIRVNLILRVD